MSFHKAQEGYVVIIKREGSNMLMTQSPGDHTEVCPSLYISLAKILFESGTSRVHWDAIGFHNPVHVP
ncbi:hypothetical protein RHSIM_Rhsim03G0181000 [Rhododendron simsii]|uniref:Uncharacterized protein n=1 Tax=Rhododendron simsii TaxID=118357 RepID=A0A834HB61_RHOSS|nr:hypothetical protein RHSIM_Rhsim03G0181000 [Rhododendron simsii]